jgi:Zn-dependent peptidase ImmA (M78 family)
MSKSFAQAKAREILNEFEITVPPVQIEEIIESHGIKLEKINAAENFDGELIPDKRLIRINKSNPKNRQRFTMAHELGHWVLYHKSRLFEMNEEPALESLNGYSLSLESKFSNKQREIEANYFASELLIPLSWIEVDWRKYKQDIKKLCDLYQVSEQALWNKIIEIENF